MYANNEVGTIQPIAEIAEILRKWKLANRNSKRPNYQLPITNYGYPLLHTDAVQAFQYLDCNVDTLGVDMLTLSAHKIYGPKGVGCLYVRNLRSPKLTANSYKLKAILTGGGQEFGLRSGTENVPAIVGFAKAVSLAAMEREDEVRRVAKLCAQAWARIKKAIPTARLNGPVLSPKSLVLSRLPNNLNFYLPKVSGEQILIALDLRGVAISSGSACTARSIDPSHVLLAMGFNRERAKNSLRLTLGRMTKSSDLTTFLKVLRIICNANEVS